MRLMRPICRLGLLAAALLAESGCATARDDASAAFTVKQRSFESSGVRILVDVYTPVDASLREARVSASLRESGSRNSRAAQSEASTAPPVLVLHGAGGMLFDGPEMKRVSERLATAGFEVYQVHYFDRTHTWFARQAVLLKLFPTWLATVRDAVDWVHGQRPEAPKIGIFGYSLGAFAAIETARRDPRIGAVVEEAGGFWHGHPEGPTREPLPPMLVIHGTADERVPNEKYTQPLLTYLRAHGDPFEKRFFPGEGHVFSSAAAAKVRGETVEFFRRHLR